MKSFDELNQFVSDIPANYHLNTFEMLYKYIPTLPEGDFLEFGTGLARATCFIALLNPKLRITTFDIAEVYNFNDYNEHIEYTLQTHGIRENVNHFIANSLEYETDKTFVGMNIDSGHSYQLTYDELVKWTPKVQKGGIIFNDDYRDKRVEVGQAIDDFMKKYGKKFEVLNDDMCFVMRVK